MTNYPCSIKNNLKAVPEDQRVASGEVGGGVEGGWDEETAFRELRLDLTNVRGGFQKLVGGYPSLQS